jgi:transcriptional regulator with XRE-family HTH domain
MNIGKRIKEQRKKLGYTADYVANGLGVSRSTIFRYENGSIEKVPTNILSSLAKILHTTPEHLMGSEEMLKEWDKKLNKDGGLAREVKQIELLEYFAKLNPKGQREAIKRVRELSHIKDYIRK